MKRREFLNAAAVVSGAVLVSRADRAYAQTAAFKALPGAQGPTPATPKFNFKTRPAKVEILFTAPGLSGNGMQVTDKGSGRSTSPAAVRTPRVAARCTSRASTAS